VSCHGATQTPDWFNGAIDVNTECDQCHELGAAEGNPEFNSYYSGEHQKHVVEESFDCTDCHDTGKLQAVHFNDLNTPDMDEASGTIRDSIGYVPPTCLTAGCHGAEDWE
jgi:hypothetical protein